MGKPVPRDAQDIIETLKTAVPDRTWGYNHDQGAIFFVDGGIEIINPFESSCGRFPANPIKDYNLPESALRLMMTWNCYVTVPHGVSLEGMAAQVLEPAQNAFWAEVASRVPGVTGYLGQGATATFNDAGLDVIHHWIRLNVSIPLYMYEHRRFPALDFNPRALPLSFSDQTWHNDDRRELHGPAP